MKASDSLFRLIKSLSKNEKGYFKKMAEALAGSGGSNYLLLFDAIDKQNEFDEAAIIKKYSKENFVKNLSVTKRNLTDLILKALRLYQSSQ
jgi:D-tyrosyl-tRNA(Tyr) deacylase